MSAGRRRLPAQIYVFNLTSNDQLSGKMGAGITKWTLQAMGTRKKNRDRELAMRDNSLTYREYNMLIEIRSQTSQQKWD